MAAPFKVKLTIYQGSTFRWQATFKNGKPPVPTNLFGYTARMQVRAEVGAPAVLIELTTENGGITLGGPAGTITLYISNIDTAALAWTDGVYDIELIAPNGDVNRCIGGAVIVSPEVTR